ARRPAGVPAGLAPGPSATRRSTPHTMSADSSRTSATDSCGSASITVARPAGRNRGCGSGGEAGPEPRGDRLNMSHDAQLPPELDVAALTRVRCPNTSVITTPSISASVPIGWTYGTTSPLLPYQSATTA